MQYKYIKQSSTQGVPHAKPTNMAGSVARHIGCFFRFAVTKLENNFQTIPKADEHMA
ncbi:hypothetical protein [Aquitalea pelogenes]|uniref:hypothetical protein n=1 Tax=Aquitalea pelogenes TaxID=1293573 RepID=UPI0035AE4C2C